MSEHLAAEQARAREAHERLAEATAAHAAEIERIRADATERIEQAEAQRDAAVAEAVEAQRVAEERADQVAADAREAIAAARAEASAANARAEAATAETARVRESAAREIDQLRISGRADRRGAERPPGHSHRSHPGRYGSPRRGTNRSRRRDRASPYRCRREAARAATAELEHVRADAAREREELEKSSTTGPETLAEARDELRRRAERAEHDLDQVPSRARTIPPGRTSRAEAAEEPPEEPGRPGEAAALTGSPCRIACSGGRPTLAPLCPPVALARVDIGYPQV